ncbi:MAG TPA: hypothetical protein HPP80_09090 [Rhodospirillaceae bacterium]|nr:hypothetical protein [Rhodospirillaceae bacterium]
MSIVLVIIGLIVGGILKGQEIVNNGRIKMQVAQIDSVKAAVNTFTDKYGYYPGDFSASSILTSTTTWDGNEDGIVGDKASSGTFITDGAAVDSEMEYVWYQVQLASLLAGVEQTAPYAYQGKLPGTVLWFGDMNWSSNAITAKMIRIQRSATPTGAPLTAVRTADAQSIDQKYDDGSPGSGQILAGTASDTTNCCKGAACSGSSTTYGLSAGTSAGTGTAANYCVLLWVVQ